MGRIGPADMAARWGASPWGVDPSGIPGAGIDVEAVREAAAALVAGGAEVRDTGADVRRTWHGLGRHYEAPEASTLLKVMDPVEHGTRQFADAVEVVARALRAYADEAEPIVGRLAGLRARAWALDSRVRRNPRWRDDPVLVADAARLVGQVRHAEQALIEAEERCAAAIRGACSAAPPTCGPAQALPAAASDGGWGSTTSRREACARVIGNDGLSYVDGVIGDGVVGGWLATASLAGLSLDGFSIETMREAWSGPLDLALPGSATWMIRRPDPDTTARAWRGMVDGLLMTEMWAENPARAAGAATFAVASAFIPGGGIKSAAQGAAAAARGTGVAARAGGRATGSLDDVAEATAVAPTRVRTPSAAPLVIHEGKQGKHLPSHKHFEPGRSELTADPHTLVQRAGTGTPVNNRFEPGAPGYRERVHFDTVIGYYVDGRTRLPSTVGILHYSKTGIHIVPGRPTS